MRSRRRKWSQEASSEKCADLMDQNSLAGLSQTTIPFSTMRGTTGAAPRRRCPWTSQMSSLVMGSTSIHRRPSNPPSQVLLAVIHPGMRRSNFLQISKQQVVIVNSNPLFNSCCSGSSVVLSSSNGRSSDEGSASLPRYKFKSNIKQRFTADLETTPEVGSYRDWTGSKNYHHRHHCRPSQKGSRGKRQEESSRSRHPSVEGDEENDQDGGGTDLTEISEESIDEKFHPPSHTIPQYQSSLNPSELSLGKLSMTGSGGQQSALPMSALASTRGSCGQKEELRNRSKSPIEKLSRSGTVRKDLVQEGIPGGTGVPAFALHETGLFYVPLTLDRDFVTPFSLPLDSAHSNPPLHPITISVCFLFGPKDAGTGIGVRQAHPGLKFSDLSQNQSNGGGTALNLSKPSPSPSFFPYVPGGSGYNGHGNPFMNHFTHQAHSPYPAESHSILGTDAEAPHFPNAAASTAKYHQFPQATQILENQQGGDSKFPFSPYDSHSRLLVPYNQHHKIPPPEELGRHSRKRHLGSQSSLASSTLSIGYHSWGENNNQSTPTMDSTADDGTTKSSWAAGDSVRDDSFMTGGKSNRAKAHGTTQLTGLKPVRNGGADAGLLTVAKRQRKANASKKNTGETVTGGKGLCIF